jgi:cell wall-associated NlpC family hydrolase
MKPFFDSPQMREQLCQHAGQWIGTPFAPHQRVHRAGVDCVNLVASIYCQCGFLNEFNPPDYSMDGGRHNEQSQLLAWLDAHRQFMRVEPLDGKLTCSMALPGDVLCFKFRSQSEHHVGLKLLGPFFVHVIARRRVEMCTLQDHTYARCLAAIYRPLLD